MNVSTATQNLGTLTMQPTATASGADSLTPKRIDAVIKSLFDKASSGDFLNVKSSAEQARRHGFTSCANSRLSDFLAEFQDTPLRTHYATAYPQCVFLTHAGLRGLMRSLNLWCDLPNHYVGAIPPEQLPWLDVFSLESSDAARMVEIGKLCELSQMAEMYLENLDFKDDPFSFGPRSYDDYRRVQHIMAYDRNLQTRFHSMAKEFQNSFFVVAPPEAFNSTEDFFTRFQKAAADASLRSTIAPDDPLVIRFVKGGCLVVAAWGEEAALLNAAAREVGV